MRPTLRKPLRTFVLMAATLVSCAWPARAQDEPGTTPLSATPFTIGATPTKQPSLIRPFLDVYGDVKHLPSRENLQWLTIGLVAAAAARPADHQLTDAFSNTPHQVRATFKSGQTIGGTPLELGAAFATYAIGRATDSPRAAAIGAELIRAQLLAQLMTVAVKETVRRSRPEGSGFSFSSGHTAMTFASATVLQRHLGWKVGIPAYAVAGYVAASRVQMKRHYLSDVVFGAALGMTAGRTVTVGHGFIVEPMFVSGGGGAVFTWNPKK